MDKIGNYAMLIRFFSKGQLGGHHFGLLAKQRKVWYTCIRSHRQFFYRDADAEKEAQGAGFGVGQWALGLLYRMVSG